MGFGPLGTSWALALKILSCFGDGEDLEAEVLSIVLVLVLYSMACFLVANGKLFLLMGDPSDDLAVTFGGLGLDPLQSAAKAV